MPPRIKKPKVPRVIWYSKEDRKRTPKPIEAKAEIEQIVEQVWERIPLSAALVLVENDEWDGEVKLIHRSPGDGSRGKLEGFYNEEEKVLGINVWGQDWARKNSKTNREKVTFVVAHELAHVFLQYLVESGKRRFVITRHQRGETVIELGGAYTALDMSSSVGGATEIDGRPTGERMADAVAIAWGFLAEKLYAFDVDDDLGDFEDCIEPRESDLAVDFLRVIQSARRRKQWEVVKDTLREVGKWPSGRG